jgi:hypothetical protein
MNCLECGHMLSKIKSLTTEASKNPSCGQLICIIMSQLVEQGMCCSSVISDDKSFWNLLGSAIQFLVDCSMCKVL